ncbi:MAG: hypothetical protein RQ715_01835 [Methylococcales bacterium]|nr:hypothetical protein [Methylococcales bacterium]
MPPSQPPPELTQLAIRHWLDTQLEQDSATQINNLYSLAKQLDQHSANIEQLDKILLTLLPTTLLFLNKISVRIQQAQVTPKRYAKVHKWQRLSLGLLTHLSCANQQWLNQQPKDSNAALLGALLLSRTLEFCYLTATPTPQTLHAMLASLQNLPPMPPPDTQSWPPGIHNFHSFQHGLLYCKLLLRGPLYDIAPDQQTACLAWHSEQAETLSRSAPTTPSIDDDLLQRQWQQQPPPITDTQQRWRLRQQLFSYSDAHDKIFPNQPELCRLTHGFSDVFKQIRADNRLNAIQKFSGAPARRSNRIALGIEPLDHEKKYLLRQQNTPSKPQHSPHELPVHLQTSTDQSFGLVVLRKDLVHVGQLVLLQRASNPIQLAVVRANSTLSASAQAPALNKETLLLEFIGHDLQAINVTLSKQTSVALSLTLPDLRKALLLEPQRSLGFGVTLQPKTPDEQHWTLGKVIEQLPEAIVFESLNDCAE